MSLIKEGHMSQFKPGKVKDKEQFVNCKLISYGLGERPEIHVFTDGSSKKPYSVLKVKSFAAVCESDPVPKIVKAKYDNYICITASGTGGKPTYLRTDTREQRDEWCRELQALINLKAESQQVAPQQPVQPHRERTRTDATSNRPPISRSRKGNTLNTAPGTMFGIFHDELNKVERKRINLTEVTEEVADCQICCDRHHLEHGLPHDAHCQATYQNVHHVANVDEWRRQQQSSKQALKETQELYNDFHQTSMIQEKDDKLEHEYETPEFHRDPLPDSINRLPGCSTSSEESASGAQAMSLPRSLHSCKEPVESSWPPSPELSAEDSEPEYPEGNPSTSFTRKLPELSRLREPEASLCVQEEQVYENTSLFQRRPRTGSKPPPLPRSASLRTESAPKLPLRKSSLPTSHQPVPPKLPEINPAVKIEAQSRKLKGEKLAGTAKVCISKATLIQNLPYLSLKKTRDCIIITKVPCELKDYFRVGDQWLKVNDAFLNGVQFAHDCVQMSDKLEIEITLKRIPFGTICDFPWTSNDVDDIGLTLSGNEIERVHPEGLAHRRGSLQSNDTTCMRSAGMRCNYIISEVNFQCVCPNASTKEVLQMIRNAGRNIVLILHPVDFRTLQRGYDIDDDDIEYENIDDDDTEYENVYSSKVQEVSSPPFCPALSTDDSEPEFPDKPPSAFTQEVQGGFCCEGLFDQRGGEMTVLSHTMTIPPRALETNTPVKISMEVLREIPDDIHLQEGEMIVTYGFWCLPSGLCFTANKPVKLTIPHCASLIDPQRIQTVLYSWSHDRKEGNQLGEPERILQTHQSCRVTPHNIEIFLEHFSGGFLAFIRSLWHVKGKLTSFMPFLPRIMPFSRKLVMELRMVNKPHGISWKDLHALDKDNRYQPAKDDDDEMVVEDENLLLTLQLEDNHPVTKEVKSKLLNRTTKHAEYFDLDLNNKPDDSLVILKLTQSKVEMDIQFRTQFFETKGAVSPPPIDPLQTRQSESANEVPDWKLVELAEKLGNHDDVEMVALKLGFTHARWQQFSDMNRDGRLTGTRSMLFDWKKNTSKCIQRNCLREVLECSKYTESAESI